MTVIKSVGASYYKNLISALPLQTIFKEGEHFAYAKRFDTEPELLIGCKLHDFFDPRQYETHIEPRLRECFSGRTVGYQIERRLNGVDRLLTIRYMPCFDKDGEVWAVLTRIFHHGRDDRV